MHWLKNSYTRRYCIAEVLIILFFKKETEIKILFILVKRLQFLRYGNNILYTVVCTIFIGVHVQSLNTFYLLFPEIFLILWILFSLCE